MKIAILSLALLIIGSTAIDLAKVHDWVQKDINNFEKYIQETDISSESLLGLQKTESGKNYQNWILSTNHKQHLELTDGQVKKSNAFGPDSEYFTEITSNLIFLGTQIKDKEWVKIAMKKSENNQQRMDMFSLDNYEGVSLINTEGEPIMNRLLIVEKRNEIISTYDEQGKSVIYLSNLQENQNLFYVLYSQNSELSDIEKLFNYIVKNIVSLEKQALQEEKPQSFDQGEEETEPNGLEEIPKEDEPKEEEQKEEEEQAPPEEQKEEQQPEEEEAEEHHQEVPEEDCPGGEEDDTVKNKVDVDNTQQLESQNDEKHVKLQTDQAVKKPEPDTETEETEEVTEEVVEEVVERKSAKKVGETKASLPPKQEENTQEPDDGPADNDEPADEPASEPESEPEPSSEEYQNCAGEELDTVKNKKDLDAELAGKQEKVFQAKEVTIKSKNEDDEGQGDSGSGDSGSGDQGSGDQGSGDQGSDDSGAGDQGSGDEGSGDQGSSDQGSNDQGSGDQESGDSGSTEDDSKEEKSESDSKDQQTDQTTEETGSSDTGSEQTQKNEQNDPVEGETDSGTNEQNDETESGNNEQGDQTESTNQEDQKEASNNEEKDQTESTNQEDQTESGDNEEKNQTESGNQEQGDQTESSSQEQEDQTESSNNEQETESSKEQEDQTESSNNEQEDQTESGNSENQTESSNNEQGDQTETGNNEQADQTESGNNEQGDQTESTNSEDQTGNNEQGDQTESSNNDDKPAHQQHHGSESKDDSEPEPCVILYSQCHFQGDELRLCGAHPVIPNDMKNFKVKSIKVPEGVQVTFFNKPNFDDERLHTKQEMECLETPLRLNLLELMNNLRLTKGVNVNSIAVTL